MKTVSGIVKKVSLVGLIAIAVTLIAAPPSDAFRGGHGHRGGGVHARVVIGVGPHWGPYWGPYWYPPPYYAYPPPVVYSPPPVVIQEQPPVYVQQAPGPEQAPPPPPPPTGASAYWYYCPSASGYYPTVQSCPEPWVKVPPRP